MAAVPKKKPSKSRARTRKSNGWAAKQKKQVNRQTVKCTNCSKMRLSHRVCPHCGFYKGRVVVEEKTQVRRVST